MAKRPKRVDLSQPVLDELQSLNQQAKAISERRSVVLATVMAQANVPEGWVVQGLEDDKLIVGPKDAEE